MVRVIRDHGANCVGTDKFIDFENCGLLLDFLTVETIADDIDFLILNPPFSQMNAFLKKCFELRKPFALLCRLDVMGTKYLREACFEKRCFFAIPSGRHLFKCEAEYIDVGNVMWVIGGLGVEKNNDDPYELYFI